MHKPAKVGDEKLAQKIADCVVSSFNGVPKSGKPTVRSNGVKEWSVLAGLVAIDKHTNKVEVLTWATGVKALPESYRAYSEGWFVHDMHAEILCIRQFNWFLIDEALKEKSEFVKEGRFAENYSLALYVSELPCGDFSMHLVAGGEKPWEEPPGKKARIARGRAHFDQLGIVRTKPGRADSAITYSKSCSDKLCAKQEVGVTSAITSRFIEPVYIDYLVVEEDQFDADAFERCFGRVDIQQGRRLRPLVYAGDKYPFRKSPGAEPSPLSLVHSVGTTHVIANGVKNGGFVKNKPPKPSGASILCNQRLAAKAQPLLGQSGSYLQLKQSNTSRQATKARVRAQMPTWNATAADDFLMH